MVQIKCSKIALVSTNDAFTAFVLDKHFLNLFTTFGDCLFDVLSAVSVCALFWHNLHKYTTERLHSELLYQLSYRGMYLCITNHFSAIPVMSIATR